MPYLFRFVRKLKTDETEGGGEGWVRAKEPTLYQQTHMQMRDKPEKFQQKMEVKHLGQGSRGSGRQEIQGAMNPKLGQRLWTRSPRHPQNSSSALEFAKISINQAPLQLCLLGGMLRNLGVCKEGEKSLKGFHSHSENQLARKENSAFPSHPLPTASL